MVHLDLWEAKVKLIKFLSIYFFGAIAGIQLALLHPPDPGYQPNWVTAVISFGLAAYLYFDDHP